MVSCQCLLEKYKDKKVHYLIIYNDSTQKGPYEEYHRVPFVLQ